MSEQTPSPNAGKSARTSSNPRWAEIQELFHAFFALRHLDPENAQRRLARERLFEALYREVPGLAKVIVRNRAQRGVGAAAPTEIGEDLAASFWNKRGITKLAGQYDLERASFYTWISRLLNNEFVDWLDRNQVRAGEAELPEADPEPVEGQWAAWGRQQGMVTRLSGQEVGRAVAGLEPELKQVVVLRVLEDLTVEETAERMGVSEATVKRRQKEAFTQLRAVLGEGEDGGASPVRT